MFAATGPGEEQHGDQCQQHRGYALTRKFAELAGVGITEAIVIAMREAIEPRRSAETPQETAARLREKHGVAPGRTARVPLPRDVFDDMWADH